MNGADIILSHIIGIRLFNMLYCNEERALFQNFTDQCRLNYLIVKMVIITDKNENFSYKSKRSKEKKQLSDNRYKQ